MVLLDGDAPGAGPRQRAEPDFAVVFAGVAGLNRRLNREPGIGLMAGGTAAAFDNARAGMDGLLGEGPLARPAAGEVVECVAAGRQCPCGGSGLLDGDGLRFFVFDSGGTGKDAGVRIDGVVQGDVDCGLDVFQHYVESMRRCFVVFVLKHQIAIAVGESDLERWLVVETIAPADVLLRGVGVGRIERGPLGHGDCLQKAIGRLQSSTPVELLQFAMWIDAEDVRDVAAVEAKGFRLVLEGSGLGHDGH